MPHIQWAEASERKWMARTPCDGWKDRALLGATGVAGVASLASGSGRCSHQDNKVLSPLSPGYQDSLVPRSSSPPPRSLPLPEAVTQLGGEVKDSSPSRKSAQGPRYHCETLCVGTSKQGEWG